MKTYLLLLSVLISGLGLAAQPVSPAGGAASPAADTNQNVAAAAVDTNREAITRRLLDRLYRGETNLAAPSPTAPAAVTPSPVPTTAQPPAGQAPATAPTTAQPGVAAPAPSTPRPSAAQPAVTTAVPTTPGAPAAGTPAAPGVPGGAVAPQPAPGAPAGGAQAGATNPQGRSMDDPFPPGLLKLNKMNIDQALDYYADIVGRTILRPSALPAAEITLKAQTTLTRREAIQALDAVFALHGIATLNIGDKFVTIVPEASAVQQAKPFNPPDMSKDDLPELGQYTTHVVQLKYAQVQDVQGAITPMAKTPASIIAIPTSNILILRDYAPNIKRMLELIDKIDVYVPGEYEPVVIPIKYALATDIQQVLASLTPSGAGVSVGRGAQPGGGRSTLPGLPGGTPGVGAPGTINPATGQPYPGTGTTSGIGSRGGFQSRLQQAVQRITSGALAGDIQIIGSAKIIADERTNSLLIFAGKQDLEAIRRVIDKLDIVLAQVLIESLIIEVSLDESSEYGVSYLFRRQDSGKFTGAGALRNNTPDGDVFGVTSLSSNLVSGFSYFARWNKDLDVVVKASAQDDRIQVLQRPRIQTSHAVEALLFVGETRPYPSTSYYGGGAFGGYASIQQLQIGVTLSVLPLINPDGLVVMDIHQKIQDSSGSVFIANVGDVPITKDREANAKVAVRDRETVVLGGFISTSSSRSKSGLPVLKDLPLIGALFRSASKKSDRRELMVFIRPTVLPTPESASLAAAAERDRLPAIKRAEIEAEEYTREQQEKARRFEEKTRKQ